MTKKTEKRDHEMIATTKKAPSKKEKEKIGKSLIDAGSKPIKRVGDLNVITDVNDREGAVTKEKIPQDAESVMMWIFKVNSRQKLYDQFLDIYPDIAKYCWGYAPYNWDNERRSILISLNEAPKKGSVILFEISRGIQDKSWCQMRTMLIPYVGYDDIEDWEVRKEE